MLSLSIIGVYVRLANKVERLEERLGADKDLSAQRHDYAEEALARIESKFDKWEKALEQNTIALIETQTILREKVDTKIKKAIG